MSHDLQTYSADPRQLGPHTQASNDGQRLLPPAAPLHSPLARAIGLGRSIHNSLSRDGQLCLHTRGRKRHSCRKLAEAHQIPTSTLWRALAIYLLTRRHPEVAHYRHLGVGHLSVVLGLPEQHQLYFLRKAEGGRWSRGQLERQIKRLGARETEHPPAALRSA